MSNRARCIPLVPSSRVLLIGTLAVLAFSRFAPTKEEGPAPSVPRAGAADGPGPGQGPAYAPPTVRREATGAEGAEPHTLPEPMPPKAVARYEGVPAPGLQLLLTGEDSTGEGATFRWVQMQGPPIALGDPTQKAVRVTVPEGTGPLGFLLIVGNPRGVDTAALTIPIQERGRGPGSAGLVADAGDDQIGLVGRRITLNGIRSEPKGRIAFRWIQVGGPEVQLKIEDGYTYSFIPPAPGIYRFALVVAADGAISEPARVNVSVAAPTAMAPAAAPAAAPNPAPSIATPPAGVVVPVDEQARAALATIGGGTEAAAALAETFESIAGRMDLYGSYLDAYSELARRLDVIIPPDPAQRSLWVERLFTPLTARLIGELIGEGLDLRRPESQAAPLTAPQRARLSDLFRAMAEGFRATVPTR